MLSARRRKVIGPCLRREEQLLQVRPGHPLQPPPLFEWKEHSSFDSAPGHDLWPFCQSGIQQLAESRLGILNRPSPTHDSPHLLFVLTSYLTDHHTRSNCHQCQEGARLVYIGASPIIAPPQPALSPAAKKTRRPTINRSPAIPKIPQNPANPASDNIHPNSEMHPYSLPNLAFCLL